ncbi:NUDIX hydrolase [Lentzea sp. NBRC 105346]|uniref:NUDIX domain-containing protein n=1 Tax=Lentzea sp. NBRC 105346 TaxID=3032205 RepID=UPI0024A48876|nr:NUDIX hydrolase [Lentzea sp. NBRC 105346]GLZ28890.1 NUDIX hydrolase [Lentzea sp. NBRC 105346]
MAADHASSSSRAVSASGALFVDEQNRILLLEPTYKDHWEIPGGYIEPGETPSEACAREVEEELGLVMKPGRLLAVDWAPNDRDGDKILFVFDGGLLGTEELAAIRLPGDEIASYEFVTVDAAADRLIPRLARRVVAAMRARQAGATLYLEHGAPHE